MITPKAAYLLLPLGFFALSGCASLAAPPPTPTLIPSPEPTSTPDVSFAVAVTPVREATSHVPTLLPTPFKSPRGPYLLLVPNAGPPTSRTITVRGGHLPRLVSVQVAWAPRGDRARIVTTAMSGRNGSFVTRFTVPGSPPGRYRIVASVRGATYASAIYQVASTATLTTDLQPSGGGDRIAVTGKNFLPNLRLLLVAYPIDVRGKPIVVGRVRSDPHGAFHYARSLRKLALGQYVLRAWSQNALVTQMAESFFQVLI